MMTVWPFVCPAGPEMVGWGVTAIQDMASAPRSQRPIDGSDVDRGLFDDQRRRRRRRRVLRPCSHRRRRRTIPTTEAAAASRAQRTARAAVDRYQAAGWRGPDAVGERRGEQGDGEDCEECQRCHGGDSGARRGSGREHPRAPRLPGEQGGQRAAGVIGSEDRGAQNEPGQGQRGGGIAQSTTEPGQRVEGVFRRMDRRRRHPQRRSAMIAITPRARVRGRQRIRCTSAASRSIIVGATCPARSGRRRRPPRSVCRDEAR